MYLSLNPVFHWLPHIKSFGIRKRAQLAWIDLLLGPNGVGSVRNTSFVTLRLDIQSLNTQSVLFPRFHAPGKDVIAVTILLEVFEDP
jgi:hypothetical protein